MDIKEFLQWKEELEDKRSARERLQGKKEISLQRLEEEFDCQSVAEARNLLTKKDKQLRDHECAYQEKLEEFTRLFGDRVSN